MPGQPRLRRSISLPFLIFYGVGTMVGGGIYALIGKVAGEAGRLAPLSIVLAGGLALLTGFAFAELSARFPVSAGEARYVREAFGRRGLSILTGWLVVATGVVSAATLSVATVGFLRDLVAVPAPLSMVLLVAGMSALALWGIGQSVATVAAITLIEVGALLYVVWIGRGNLVPADLPPFAADADSVGLAGLLAGAFLSIYAFIGFEDLVNTAEEIKDVRRTLPRAILASLLLTTGLYLAVSLVAVRSVPPAELAATATPIAAVVQAHGGRLGATGLTAISLLAGLNGALVQIVMASRVMYGLARRHDAPRWLGRVAARTRTPVHATLATGASVLALALFFPLTQLARATSAIILMVFALVNLGLVVIKRRDGPPRHADAPAYPIWLPAAGCVACLAILVFELARALDVAG